MRCYRLLPIFVACTVLSFAMNSASGALPPGAIAEMKKDATDLLEIEVGKVEKRDVEDARMLVKCTAKVTKVDRSKSGRKPGDTIHITYYRTLKQIPGPKNPPLVTPGWKGKVYLNAGKAAGNYELAVFGHSFVGEGEE